MSGTLERGMQLLQCLAAYPRGRALSLVASDLGIPLSATHRLLMELIRLGYVRQSPADGQYVLTIKLVSMGLSFLSSSGIVDVAQPLLDDLAASSEELVRLAVVDGNDLIFVAKSQGATRGLRYDPDMGLSVALSCSAAGHAWLATMSDKDAAALVARQGFGVAEDFGPGAPRSMKAVLPFLRATRERGFALIENVFATGMGSVGAAVRLRNGAVVGVVTIAGPLLRFTGARMAATGEALLQAATDLAQSSSASPFFKR